MVELGFSQERTLKSMASRYASVVRIQVLERGMRSEVLGGGEK